jgi:hypothetical protein
MQDIRKALMAHMSRLGLGQVHEVDDGSSDTRSSTEDCEPPVEAAALHDTQGVG